MGDYCCNYCSDSGNCSRCSYFFQPNKIHDACGFTWGDHPVNPNQDGYSPWAECPKKETSDA
jgi:hypothetical protein